MLPSRPANKRPPSLSFIYLTIFIDAAEKVVWIRSSGAGCVTN